MKTHEHTKTNLHTQRSTEEGIREDEMDELRDGMMEGVSRKVVVLVCDFVLLQCSKPAPAHSKVHHKNKNNNISLFNNKK